MVTSDRMDPRWRQTSLLIGAVLVWLFVAYHATFADMMRVWATSSTFNHCFLIAPLSLFLIWERRENLRALTPGPSAAGFGYVAVNALIWIAGSVSGVAFLQHLGAVGLLIGSVWAVLGGDVMRTLRFPLFYLYFSVPEGEFLVPHLQDLTASISVKLLEWTGVPVFREARYITIPSGRFVVAEACSGINYLIATLAVGSLFAYIAYRSWRRRAVFMALAVLVPLLANGTRAYGIIMIADLSGFKYAVGIDHVIYGWLFFGIVMLVLFAIGNLFSDVQGTAVATVPVSNTRNLRPGSVVVAAAATAALLAVGPVFLTLRPVTEQPAPPVAAPAGIEGWSGPTPATDVLESTFSGANQQLSEDYRRDGATVTLNVAYYATQAKGREVVGAMNRPYNERVWQRIDGSRIRIGSGSEAFHVRQLLLRIGGTDRLVWWWYDIHGHRTDSPVMAKLWEARARVFGSDLGAAAVSVSTPVIDGRENATKRLNDFVAGLQPGLLRMTARR